MYKKLFSYLKENNIQHLFNERTNEVYVSRDVMNNELRSFATKVGFNIFELDTVIVIF